MYLSVRECGRAEVYDFECELVNVRICENVRLQLGKQGVQCARVNVNLCEYSM